MQTPYGELRVLEVTDRHPNGKIKACIPKGANALATPFGLLTPQHSTDDLRKKTVQPVTFHAEGGIASLPLETQTLVQTPAGPIPAELLSFHPNGALRRVFPLNGRLSGYWTQEDESALAESVTLKTPQGDWKHKLVGACFTPEGALHSITFWPGETQNVSTPAGAIEVRIGVSFYPDGSVRCIEPAGPHPVQTLVGEVLAFDPDAVGISGDANSLAFGPNGLVTRVATVQTHVHLHPLAKEAPGEESSITLSPGQRESLCGFTETEPVPLHLELKNGDLFARLGAVGETRRFAVDNWEITTKHQRPELGRMELTPRMSCEM